MRGQEADYRSDIFALGAVLYEMLTGARAFAAGSTIETLSAILNTDPLERRDLSAALPASVEDLVRHCLEKQPNERFQSARDLAFQLQALSTSSLGPGVGPAPPSPAPHRTWRLGYAAAVLLLAGAASWGWPREPAGAADGEPLVLPLRIDNPPRLRSPWTRGIALSPDGNRLAYYGSGGWYSLDVRDGSTSRIPTGTGLALQFSPAGDEVAISREGRIQPIDVVNLATGQPRRLVGCCFGLSDWDLNGWLYHTDLKNNLVRTHVDGRSEVVDPPLSADHWPNQQARATRTGRVVVFVRKPEKGTAPDGYRVVAKELATGRERALGAAVDAYPAMSGHLLLIKADGTVLSAPFDEASLSFEGDPVPVLQNVQIKIRGSGNTPEAALALSRNGTLAYVSRAEPARDSVLTVNRNGTQASNPVEWPGWLHDLDYSEDARQVASMHPGLKTPNVFARTARQAEPRRVTFSDNLDYWPRFIPRSQDIAYVRSTEGKNWDLYRVPFDGSEKPTSVLDLEGDIWEPRFTTDGRWVVFYERGLDGSDKVRAFELGTKTDPITIATGNSPDVSPDRRWLAYQATDSGGTPQIWVRSFPRAGESPWQVSTTGGTKPVWAANGRELFYLNTSRELVSVRVTIGPRFRFDSPRILFRLAGNELWPRVVLPGGQQFLLIRRNLEAPGQVMMIRNFFALLRQRVGG